VDRSKRSPNRADGLLLALTGALVAVAAVGVVALFGSAPVPPSFVGGSPATASGVAVVLARPSGS